MRQYHCRITGCDTVSCYFNVSKRAVFERVSSGIMPFNMIIELGSSNIVTDSVNNEVIKFMFTWYVYVVRLRVRRRKGLLRLE